MLSPTESAPQLPKNSVDGNEFYRLNKELIKLKQEIKLHEMKNDNLQAQN